MANKRERNSVFNRSSITRVIASQFVLTLILEVCSATWSTTPGPYYQRFNDGSYNYGYSAGRDYSARQSGTAANEVTGQYSQLLPDGKLVNVRYNAGVGGFRPQLGTDISTTARPYGYSYNTGDAFHQAAADQSGNVRGNYWYRDSTGGRHDLRYMAGPGIGFVPTGGSLAIPNGLGRRSLEPVISSFGVTYPRWSDPTANAYGDGSDGRFSYANPETYDPNGAHSRSRTPTAGTINRGGPAAGDGSHNFGYQTPDSARQEGSDGRGNVHGAYSFQNGGSNHDLAYVAGPGIGFQPTGGTLARPNGLGHGGGSGSYGIVNNRGGVGRSSGGINNAAGANGLSGLGHRGVGHRDPPYNAGGLGSVGAAEVKGGSVSSGDDSGQGNVSGIAGLPRSGSLGTIPRGFGHGLNNAGGSSGVAGGPGDRSLASGTPGLLGSGGRVGDGSSGTGLGLQSTSGTGQAGIHGQNQPNLANTNAARGFGEQGYAGGGLASGSSNGINRSEGHYQPSGLANNAGLLGSAGGWQGAIGSRRVGIDDNDVVANNLNNLGTRSSEANHGGLGSHGNGGFSGSGIGKNSQNGAGDHRRFGAGTTGNGGHSYGTSAGSSADGSGIFGSSGSERNGINGGGNSAGSSVKLAQSSRSEHQSGVSDSSLGSSGEVASGEQHDLQRNVDLEQRIQALRGSSATKGISQR